MSLQVLEDLLAGGAYDDRHGHGVHGDASLDAAHLGRRLGGAGGEAYGVAVL